MVVIRDVICTNRHTLVQGYKGFKKVSNLQIQGTRHKGLVQGCTKHVTNLLKIQGSIQGFFTSTKNAIEICFKAEGRGCT